MRRKQKLGIAFAAFAYFSIVGVFSAASTLRDYLLDNPRPGIAGTFKMFVPSLILLLCMPAAIALLFSMLRTRLTERGDVHREGKSD